MEYHKKKNGISTRHLIRFAFLFALFILMTGLLGGGCTTYNETNPARSATEQLLISTAMDRAMTNGDLSVFSGKKVFIDATYFASYDQTYALGEIRDQLSLAGAILVGNITNSDLVLEPRSGALSIDASSILFGVPAMGLPVPLSGAVSTPEIAFYKSVKQDSIGKIALLAYDAKSGAHYYSSGPLVGRAYTHYRKILFIAWLHTDVPEKQKNAKKRREESIEFNTPPPPSDSPAPLASPSPAPASGPGS
jgi:hypothetical protein